VNLQHPPQGQVNELQVLLSDLIELRKYIQNYATEHSHLFSSLGETKQLSAKNFIHYMALRGVDLRHLQHKLPKYGLSSLGRSEASVMNTLEHVIKRVSQMYGLSEEEQNTLDNEIDGNHSLSFEKGQEILTENASKLLGEIPSDRHISIMVTCPKSSEVDINWFRKQLKAGMNILRVNCAYEGPEQWKSIIEQLKTASSMEGRECKVGMDLAGPKIRTGQIAEEDQVFRLKSRKDIYGKISEAGKFSIRPLSFKNREAKSIAPSIFYVQDETFENFKKGDRIYLKDCRKKKRKLCVCEVHPGEVVVESKKSIYLTRSSDLYLKSREKVFQFKLVFPTHDLGHVELNVGEDIYFWACGENSNILGANARFSKKTGKKITPAQVTCNLNEELRSLKIGDRILFDDGKIAGQIKEIDFPRFTLNITRAKIEGSKLKSFKGVNFPDSELLIKWPTQKDLKDLEFAAKYADLIGLSFVRCHEDVESFLKKLAQITSRDIGIYLKIETNSGFNNLGRILLSSLKHPNVGVMIARGDLAVECGFERLAELQEEILWLCEACHIPVIWATQVLENLARTGLPSRAEITDAAMSVRAECVMLNKGPYIDLAVETLGNILSKMEFHQEKKRSLYRKLDVSDGLDSQTFTYQ
jgi:pyruvate kinase